MFYFFFQRTCGVSWTYGTLPPVVAIDVKIHYTILFPGSFAKKNIDDLCNTTLSQHRGRKMTLREIPCISTLITECIHQSHDLDAGESVFAGFYAVPRFGSTTCFWKYKPNPFAVYNL